MQGDIPIRVGTSIQTRHGPLPRVLHGKITEIKPGDRFPYMAKLHNGEEKVNMPLTRDKFFVMYHGFIVGDLVRIVRCEVCGDECAHLGEEFKITSLNSRYARGEATGNEDEVWWLYGEIERVE